MSAPSREAPILCCPISGACSPPAGAAVDDGTHVDPHGKTVGDWLRGGVATVKNEVAQTTWQRYREVDELYTAPSRRDK
jgi:hypothetical protein